MSVFSKSTASFQRICATKSAEAEVCSDYILVKEQIGEGDSHVGEGERTHNRHHVENGYVRRDRSS